MSHLRQLSYIVILTFLSIFRSLSLFPINIIGSLALSHSIKSQSPPALEYMVCLLDTLYQAFAAVEALSVEGLMMDVHYPCKLLKVYNSIYTMNK